MAPYVARPWTADVPRSLPVRAWSCSTAPIQASVVATAARLEEVRRLLETTTWSIERTARACGFGSAVTLRQNFAAAYATTPTSYRQRFRVSDGA